MKLRYLLLKCGDSSSMKLKLKSVELNKFGFIEFPHHPVLLYVRQNKTK